MDNDTPEQGELIASGFSFLVTHEQLGEVLDLGHSMIAKLRDEGMPQVRRGVYDLRQCVQWYVDKWRRARGDVGGEEQSTRAALNIAQRERIELEIARTKGESLSRAAVVATFARLGVVLAARLNGLPARAADDLQALATPAEKRAYLREEVRSILAQLATTARDVSSEAEAAMVAGTEDAPAPTKPKRRQRKGPPP